MIDKNNIVARLTDGDSIETIAKEIADMLNEANQEYEKILQEEEELAKIKEEAKREEELQAEIDKRVYLVQQMENAIMDYIAECHPCLYGRMAEESLGAESALDIASYIDTICSMLEMLT